MGDNVLDVLKEAIGTANIRYPIDLNGVLRKQEVMPVEEAIHFANAVLFGLYRAGYHIVPLKAVADADRT